MCKDLRAISYLRCTYAYVYIRLFHPSLLQFIHRSISFDPVTVEFLLLSFHGGISSSIVTKKEDNGQVEGKERRHIRTAGSAGVEYAAMGCSTKALEIGLYLFFNPFDLPSIYFIRSGDGRISSSILPRWDFFFHRYKERGQWTS